MCRLQGAKPSAAQDLRLSGVFGCLPSFKGSFCCEDVDIAKVGQDGDAGDAGEAASWRLWWLFHASLVHSRNWRSFMRERRQGAKAGRNEFSVLAARKSESEDFDQVMGSMEKNSVVLYFLKWRMLSCQVSISVQGLTVVILDDDTTFHAPCSDARQELS